MRPLSPNPVLQGAEVEWCVRDWLTLTPFMATRQISTPSLLLYCLYASFPSTWDYIILNVIFRGVVQHALTFEYISERLAVLRLCPKTPSLEGSSEGTQDESRVLDHPSISPATVCALRWQLRVQRGIRRIKGYLYRIWKVRPTPFESKPWKEPYLFRISCLGQKEISATSVSRSAEKCSCTR